jgi:hypothetical protein
VFDGQWWSDKPMSLHGRKSALRKKAKRGFRGHPVATVAFYGPDDQIATKVAVGIVEQEDAEVSILERWFCEGADIRVDPAVESAVIDFITEHAVKTVVLSDGIIGCPHEETIDYPEGTSCPKCPFWAGRDRWTKQRIQ